MTGPDDEEDDGDSKDVNDIKNNPLIKVAQGIAAAPGEMAKTANDIGNAIKNPAKTKKKALSFAKSVLGF